MRYFKYVIPVLALTSTPSLAEEIGKHCWQQRPSEQTSCFSINRVSDLYFSLIGERNTPNQASTPLYGLALFDVSTQTFKLAFTQNAADSLVFENFAQISLKTLSGTWRDDKGNSGDFQYVGEQNQQSNDKTFNLGIFHINDHHSHLTANPAASLSFNGQVTTVEMGGFPRVVAKIKERAVNYQNILKLHAGDAITGDLYYTLFKGGADTTLMNQICFDAMTLGSHEFDEGDAGVKALLDYLNAGDATGVCGTATLAANVVPKLGVSPLALTHANEYLKPYLIKQYGGAKVGIIGIVNANKTKNSSRPDASTEFTDEATTAQQYIDELIAKGVNKIILLTHYQYQNDIALAKKLSGVDVIVGGDSHSLLGNNLAQFGLKPEGPYPTMTTDKNGNQVCVVQAWQYAWAVGELNVNFTADGRIDNCTGTTHVLLGETFKRNGVELKDAARQEVVELIKNTPELSIVQADRNANIWVNYAAMFADMLKLNVIGRATENLCLERIPGQGRSQICDVSMTRAHGSDIANIAALAFKNLSPRADISIQNAGGVRVDVPIGDITIATAYTLMPFANTLVNLEVTGAELVQILEGALDYAIDPNGSNGSYPYASGLRWTVDLSKPKGQRFSNIEVKLKKDTAWSPINLAQTYVVVTSNFLASGKDGYQGFAPIFANSAKTEDTSLDYAQSFIDYVKSVGTVSKLPASEYSTQLFYDARGQLQN